MAHTLYPAGPAPVAHVCGGVEAWAGAGPGRKDYLSNCGAYFQVHVLSRSIQTSSTHPACRSPVRVHVHSAFTLAYGTNARLLSPSMSMMRLMLLELRGATLRLPRSPVVRPCLRPSGAGALSTWRPRTFTCQAAETVHEHQRPLEDFLPTHCCGCGVELQTNRPNRQGCAAVHQVLQLLAE
jgi:hypothetical protein